MKRDFSERDVQLFDANPAYTGIGPYPQIIVDDLWVNSALKAIRQRGVNFWIDVQTNIIKSLGLPEEKASAICMNSQKLYDMVQGDEEHKEILHRLLFSCGRYRSHEETATLPLLDGAGESCARVQRAKGDPRGI